MFENVKKADIEEAIEELLLILGVKEPIVPMEIIGAINVDIESGIQLIASRLDLPVKIKLHYVTESPNKVETNRFRSYAVVRTDRHGRGIGSITAQVTIPPMLPMFGSQSLTGYPIDVFVSSDCRSARASFAAIIAHELSHVLLAALWSKHKDSELHADLVPILLGFAEIVRGGRKSVRTTTDGEFTKTITTSFGYLTDEQFGYAVDHVDRQLLRARDVKARLLSIISGLEKTLQSAFRSLQAFRIYRDHLDTNPPRRMKADDAQRIVHLHSQDETENWERVISDGTSKTAQIRNFALPLIHYTKRSIARLENNIKELEQTAALIHAVAEQAKRDEKLLKKYLSVVYKLKRLIASDSR